MNAIGCLTNVALNLLLIPAYGGMGAVVATLASYGVVGILTCFLYRPLFRTGGMLIRAMVWPKVW